MITDDDETGEWGSYRRLILKELQRSSQKLDSMDEKIGAMRVDIAMLQVKASAWGLLGGTVAAVGALIIQWLQRTP